jgi:hypothetical protein
MHGENKKDFLFLSNPKSFKKLKGRIIMKPLLTYLHCILKTFNLFNLEKIFSRIPTLSLFEFLAISLA